MIFVNTIYPQIDYRNHSLILFLIICLLNYFLLQFFLILDNRYCHFCHLVFFNYFQINLFSKIYYIYNHHYLNFQSIIHFNKFYFFLL